MTKEQSLELIKLLDAIESWSFADTHRTAGVCDDFHLSRLVTVAGITTPEP